MDASSVWNWSGGNAAIALDLNVGIWLLSFSEEVGGTCCKELIRIWDRDDISANRKSKLPSMVKAYYNFDFLNKLIVTNWAK